MTINELEKEIKDLPDEDCLRLFERLGLGEAAKMLNAKIYIYDLDQDNRVKPRAVIKYKNGKEESIDIIDSVRNNAASIGHPAILLAIHRWEQIIRYYHSFTGNQDYLNIFRDKPLKSLTGETILAIAQNHLNRVVKATLEGAQKRALTKEAVFTIAVGGLGYDTEYDYLRVAAEWLATKEMNNIRRPEKKLEILRQKLETWGDIGLLDHLREEGIGEDQLNEYRDKLLINPIIDFLNSDKGKKFLSRKFNLISRSNLTKAIRPEASLEYELPEKDNKWRGLVNAFDAWRFNLDVATVKTYRSNGINQAKSKKTNSKTIEDDQIISDDEFSNSNAKENLIEMFLSDDGYHEETAVYPSYGPKQPFKEILDPSILSPEDPGYFLFINISSDLSVPYPLATYPGYLLPIESCFQSLRTWMVLPSIPKRNK